MASALTGPIVAFNEIIGCTIDDPKVSQIASDVGVAYTVWEDEELPDIHWIFECKGLGLYGVDISQFRRHWNRSYGVRSTLVGFFVSLSIFQREMPTAEHADMWEKGPAKGKLVPCHWVERLLRTLSSG